jgi:hypothetical protein
VELNCSEEIIYALIAKAIATRNPPELEAIMKELRAALQEHVQRMRLMAAAKLLLDHHEHSHHDLDHH